MAHATRVGVPTRRTRNIVVLGSSMVGKTAMCVRFANDRFDESYEPTYENSFSKLFTHNGREIDIYIKDTQGLADQDIFRAEYGLGYHGYVLVYSISSARSLEIVKGINAKLINLIGTKNVPRVLVGNKSDLHNENLRQVSTAAGQALADKWGCAFVEASPKFNFNVDQVFTALLDEIDRCSDPSSSLSASARCIDILSCCQSESDTLSDQTRWEKWLQPLITTILFTGIAAIICGLVIGIRTDDDSGSLICYVLFGFGVMISLISCIGLYGVHFSSYEFVRVYGISLSILFLTTIVVWILMYQNIRLFQDYSKIALITTICALIPQFISIIAVYCYQSLLIADDVEVDPFHGSVNSYHTLYQ